MTVEQLHPLFDHARESKLQNSWQGGGARFHQRCHQVTALKKPDGGVRGIVACRAGCECVAHAQGITEVSANRHNHTTWKSLTF